MTQPFTQLGTSISMLSILGLQLLVNQWSLAFDIPVSWRAKSDIQSDLPLINFALQPAVSNCMLMLIPNCVNGCENGCEVLFFTHYTVRSYCYEGNVLRRACCNQGWLHTSRQGCHLASLEKYPLITINERTWEMFFECCKYFLFGLTRKINLMPVIRSI